MADSDTPSLLPDVTGIQNSAKSAMTAMMAIASGYCSAVGSIYLGPRPYTADGATGTCDPFEKTAFKTAMTTIQSHTYSFVPTVMMPISNWGDTFAQFGFAFPDYANGILTTVAAVGTASPTASQRADVMANFDKIKTGLAGLQSGLQATQPNLLQFIQWKAADLPILTAGPNSIQSAITGVQTWFANEAIAYMGPTGAAIVAVLGDLSTAITATMQSALTEVQTATTASDDASSACSSLLNFMSDLLAKCDSVITFVTDAEDAAFASAIQRIDLKTASSEWTQLANFVQNTI